MALRDQPYFPFYVQDYLTDEKLNNCSASSQGVYVKLMCLFHKSENYGGILFKQKDKQLLSMMDNIALKCAKLLPFDFETIKTAIAELIEEKVLHFENDILFQKRMVRDFAISEARAAAGKKGGGNPNLIKQKDKQLRKQKNKQNTEYEYENENENEEEYSLEKDSKKKPLKKSNLKNTGLAKTDHGPDFQKIIDLGFKESLDLAQEIDQVWIVWLAYKKSELNFTYKTHASNNVGKMELYDYSQGNLTQAKQIVLKSIGKKWKGLVRPEQSEQKTEIPKIVTTVDEACKIASQIRQNQTA